MQQRRLRLGDILDDYCPRERRITNHAVVAMIDDEVKQTRCTTCDADHEYKQARIPPQRRKKANAGGEAEGAGRLRPVEEETIASEDIAVAASEPEETFDPAPVPLPVEEEPAETNTADPTDDDGPVHRRLIRATLPRPDGQAPERKDPEFTIRQPGMRGPGGKRGRHQRSMRPQGGGSPSRFGGPRHGSGQGPRHAGGSGHGNRPTGNRSGSQGAPRGNRQGNGGGRGGRKRGR